MTIYEIRPSVGAGPLTLGMFPADVHSLLGQPRTTSKSFIGERSDSYPQLTVSYEKGTDALGKL